MELIVQVSPEVGRAWQGYGPSSPESEELQARARSLGITLRQQHPQAADSSLARFLVANVPNWDIGEQVAKRLRECAGVQAAYVKPAAEPP